MRFFARLRHVRLTTAIAALMLVSIAVTIAAYSVSTYLSLRGQALDQAVAQQSADLKTAATIYERRLNGSVLTWSEEDGSIVSFTTYSIPFFYDTAAVDSVTRVTGGETVIFGLDEAGQFIAKSTSFETAEGERVVDFVLDPASPVAIALLAGQPFHSEMMLEGTTFNSAAYPVFKLDGTLLGGFWVGKDVALADAAAASGLPGLAAMGVTLLLVMGALGLLMSRILTRPIPRLAGFMDAIASGDYTVSVPFVDRGNEIGAMARAVEVFRENGLRVSEMTEAEAARIIADEENRRQMMRDLQGAFGEVVDAAVAGDFSQRVATQFPDAELNVLASSVNNLVSTVDRGIAEVGSVLGALASTTTTVGLGTGHHCNLFRHPVEFAHASLSVQRLSGGRFEAGLGAGWTKDELVRSGRDMPSPGERASRLIEAAQIVRQLFDTGSATFKGEHYEVDMDGLDRLEGIGPPPLVIAAGGRVYLTKDGFTRAEHYRAMEPRLPQFLAVREKWDPHRRLRSAQSVRLFGDQA